jgi:Cu(I)/Ag(I) efflux system membrane fusion protein
MSDKLKKNGILLIIAFAVLAFVLGLITAIKKKSQQGVDGVTPQTTSSDSVKNKEADRIKEVWTCPMHPHIKKDGPGSCPICGMNLVKSETTGESNSETSKSDFLPEGHAPFQLSFARQQMIGVKVGEVQKKMLFKSIDAAGRIAFDPELYTAQNEYVEAVKQAETVKNSPIADVKHSADRMVESAKLRLKILGLADGQISALGRNGTTGSNLLVPKQGENLWVYAEVFEMDLSSIQAGLEATISGGSLGRKSLKGKVASVDRVINPMTRTAKVRILIPNTSLILRPEAYVDVSILSPLGEQITVPFDSILDTGKQAWVFVVRENGDFDPRLVTIVDRAGEEVAIASGVHPGEKIVTSANFLVDSESRLKGVQMGQAEDPKVTENTDSDSATKNGSAAKESKPIPSDKTEKIEKKKTPECPSGEFWHEQMKHCMPKM